MLWHVGLWDGGLFGYVGLEEGGSAVYICGGGVHCCTVMSRVYLQRGEGKASGRARLEQVLLQVWQGCIISGVVTQARAKE